MLIYSLWAFTTRSKTCAEPQLCIFCAKVGLHQHNGKTDCTNAASNGCECILDMSTPGFEYDKEQSCQANSCYVVIKDGGIAQSQNLVRGCGCIPNKNTPRLRPRDSFPGGDPTFRDV